MKPLLLPCPAPNRSAPICALLEECSPAEAPDIAERMNVGVAGALDAVALQPDGGQALALGIIRRRGELGLLGPLWTRPQHRREGHARRLLQTLLAWFDMTGGRRLYLVAPAACFPEWLAHFGFRPLHFGGDPLRVSLLRTPAGLEDDPLTGVEHSPPCVEPLGPSDWAALHALAQHRLGADPRLSPAESALAAEAMIPELFTRLGSKRCALLGVRRGEHLAAAVTVALDATGPRTYALRWPYGENLPALADATAELARRHGYEQVDYPLESQGAVAPPRD